MLILQGGDFSLIFLEGLGENLVMKTAVFSCLGLGDGLISLILSHNLAKQGHEVVTFHPFLQAAQEWFPSLPIRPFPPVLEEFDRFFIFYEKTEWMERILNICLEKYRKETTVLNPIATPHTDYKFWEEGKFQGHLTLVENLYLFCKDVLKIEHPTYLNGIVIPERVIPGQYNKRVVLHPTSSRPGKNWSKKSFLKLESRLKKEGFDPYFVVSPKEKEEWREAIAFDSLSDLFQFVAESSYMIGNDSGIGHLASCLGLPTLTLCRNERTANFWKPSWGLGKVCLPHPWIPNIKGLRLRDKFWHKGISVGRVFKNFKEIVSVSN